MPTCNAVSDGSILYFTIMIGLTIFGNEWCVMEAIPKNFLYNGSPNLSVVNCAIIFTVTVQLLVVIRSILVVVNHKRKVRDYLEGKTGAEKPEIDGMPYEPKQFALQVAAYFIL